MPAVQTDSFASHGFRNAVLTGACGGLGQALGQQLIAQGAKVALLGMSEPALAALAALAPERTRIYRIDVADSQAMQAVAQDWLDFAGMPDLVIANAGVASGFDTAQAEDLQVLRRMLEINVLGPVTTFQPFVRALHYHGASRCALVGVASIAGWRGMPGNGAYCASKSALIRYLESLRAEWRGTPVSVHTVCPGYLRTALTAHNQFAMPGLMEPEAAARTMLARIAKGHTQIVVPRRTGWLSRLVNSLPDAWADALLRKQPRKARWGQSGSNPIPGMEAPRDTELRAKTK